MIGGDEKIEGIYYNETFASTAKLISLRTFLGVVAKGWKLHQIDVFLYGDPDQKVYMTMPLGFCTSNQIRYVGYTSFFKI